MKTESSYLSIIVFLLLIYSFFGYLFNDIFLYLLLLLSTLGLLVYLLFKKTEIYNEQIIILILIGLFIITQLLSIFYSMYQDASLKVGILRITLLLVGALLIIQNRTFEKGLKLLFIFSTIHMSFTFFSFLFPNYFITKIIPVLPKNVGEAALVFMTNTVSTYPGITDSIGLNAYYISVAVGVLYSFTFFNNKSISKKGLIILGISMIALMLTGKRGHLISAILSMIMTSIIISKIRKKHVILKTTIVLGLVTIFFTAVYRIFPNIAISLTRFSEKIDGDQTSGRITLYKFAIEHFKEKPLFGIGTGSFSELYGIGNHNLILQLLSENGVVGLVSFLSIILFNLFITVKVITIKNKEEFGSTLNYLIFSLYFQIFFILYGLTGNTLNDGFILVNYLICSSLPYIHLSVNRSGYDKKLIEAQTGNE